MHCVVGCLHPALRSSGVHTYSDLLVMFAPGYEEAVSCTRHVLISWRRSCTAIGSPTCTTSAER